MEKKETQCQNMKSRPLNEQAQVSNVNLHQNLHLPPAKTNRVGISSDRSFPTVQEDWQIALTCKRIYAKQALRTDLTVH